MRAPKSPWASRIATHPARKRSRKLPSAARRVVPLVGAAIAFAGAFHFADRWIPALAAAPLQRASFPLCGEGKRITCIVDGDTVWLDGEKIRLNSINAPEKTDPACAREAELAAKATARLREILNQNAWQVTRHGKDKYGRTLAEFRIGAGSAGAMLVSEGLAHNWDGVRKDWCG